MNESNPRQLVTLRDILPEDLIKIYEHQLDPEANEMARTKPRSPVDFQNLWNRVLTEPDTITRAILADDDLAGNITCFSLEDRRFVGYWIDRKHWSKGVATQALKLFLEQVPERPLHALVAENNAGSVRVLERSGFKFIESHDAPETDRFLPCTELLYELG